jgi:ABC-type Zn uptake system ZnuABC Zn-binding protein ZnuA
VTSAVTSTYTTLCPTTSTKTENGQVITVTYTTESVVTEVVPTTIEVITTVPGSTQT